MCDLPLLRLFCNLEDSHSVFLNSQLPDEVIVGTTHSSVAHTIFCCAPDAWCHSSQYYPDCFFSTLNVTEVSGECCISSSLNLFFCLPGNLFPCQSLEWSRSLGSLVSGNLHSQLCITRASLQEVAWKRIHLSFQ